jgi:hypothetical protein
MLPAGSTVLHSFSVQNGGNVPLRNLQLETSSLTDVTCTPTTGTTLPVGQSITCQGTHAVTTQEATAGSSSLHVVFTAGNIMDSAGATFRQEVALQAVEISMFASYSLVLDPRNCSRGELEPKSLHALTPFCGMSYCMS